MRDKCTRGVDPSTCACQKLIHALQAAAIEPLFFCGPVAASAAFYIFLYSVWSLVFTATFLFCFERFGPRCHSFGSLLAYVSLIDHQASNLWLYATLRFGVCFRPFFFLLPLSQVDRLGFSLFMLVVSLTFLAVCFFPLSQLPPLFSLFCIRFGRWCSHVSFLSSSKVRSYLSPVLLAHFSPVDHSDLHLQPYSMFDVVVRVGYVFKFMLVS